jgi:hypothetical protein
MALNKPSGQSGHVRIARVDLIHDQRYEGIIDKLTIETGSRPTRATFSEGGRAETIRYAKSDLSGTPSLFESVTA